MQCDTCQRLPSSRLQFHCVACARNALYELRVENATILLENESLGKDIEAITAAPATEDSRTNEKGRSLRRQPLAPNKGSRWTLEQIAARSHESRARTESAVTESEKLRDAIAEGRSHIQRLKDVLAQRRSDQDSATHNLPHRRSSALDLVKKSVKRTNFRAGQLHQNTAESRVFLCREAANLYRLRQRRRKKNGVIREDYSIGGVSVVDLRDLNNANPAQVTTSLTHICNLLVLVSHYLSLQLPAEITLPHRDYPLPTIFNPASSYSSRKVPFPGSTPSHSSSNSPTASRTSDIRPLPRPRPLYLDKPLPALAKDSPAGYALFIEGVTLLAWDISWMCRTQGLNLGAGTWEDVCPIGRNLWYLLVAPRPSSPQPPPSRTTGAIAEVATSSSRTTPTKNDNLSPAPSVPSSVSNDTRSYGVSPAAPSLGYYSHGTVHGFLGAAEAVDYMRSWKLQRPAHIADKLKAGLLGDMAGAEWELLEEREWGEAAAEAAAAEQQQEQATLLGDNGRRDRDKGTGVAETPPGPATTAASPARRPSKVADPRDSGPDNREESRLPEEKNTKPGSAGAAPGSGTSGWTKLKPR